jgi:hypothetical protein
MKTINTIAVTCLAAGLAIAALDAAASSAPATFVVPSGTVSVLHSDTTPIQLARRGADDPPGHVRRGRGTDDAVSPSRRGTDDPATDQRRGRGRDDVTPGGRGADDPPGHLRRGRGADDPLNHG